MTKPIFETPDIEKRKRRAETTAEPCAHQGCAGDGLYRAPRSRSELRDYIWFCLDHIRAYNRQWNYFAGLDESGMEEAIRQSTTWERPSWKFGTASARGMNDRIDDPLGLFGDANRPDHSRQMHPPIDPEERKALDIFGLTPCADAETMKKRYKELAKTYHPDANGGSREAEDKLKMINWAYSVLKPLIISRAS